MKFKYKQKVIITDEFYKGTTGIIVSKFIGFFGTDYLISFDGEIKHAWIKEKNLELQPTQSYNGCF